MPVVTRNGHLYLRYCLGRDPVTQKRIERFHRAKSDNPRQAKSELRDILSARDRGEPVDVSRMTLAAFLPKWLEHIDSTRRLSPRTLHQYRRLVETRLIPDLGKAELRKLNAMGLSDYYSRLLKEGRVDGAGGLSARSVRQIHNVLHGALKTAVLWQIITRNPADNVPLPTEERYRPTLPTKEQVESLLERIHGLPLYLAVVIGAATGLREGAICGLMWGDVDLVAGRLLSHAAAIRIPGQTIVKGTKTGREQLVSIPAYAAAILSAYRQARPELSDSDYVLSGGPEPHSPKRVADQWRYHARRVGMRGVRFHDLRHWQATMLYQAGADLKAISARLGHSAIAITANLYTHLLLEAEDESARKIDAILGRKPDYASERSSTPKGESIPESI